MQAQSQESEQKIVARTYLPGREEAYQKYYDEKLPDAEIARRIGVTRSAVYEWRRGEKLPVNPDFPSTKSCLPYYERGFSDKEIAAVTGIKEASVAHWRYRNGLPAVSRYREQETPAGTVRVGKGVPDYMKYYDQGWNDAEIAAAVNRTYSAVQSWRRKNNLEPRVGRGRPAESETHVPVGERKPRRILTPG
jgi:hypothetical protein